jgi:mRNA-degrading endonuclease HigB of HigAB toxin-antitoxin module
VIENGYKLEFDQIPPFLGIKETFVNSKQMEILEKEVSSLLKKNAIETVPKSFWKKGFYSTLFLVTKKTGDLRPVINLKPLNRYLKKQHFKMDTLSKVLNLVQKGDWAFTLDLKDAYFHIPIFKKHRKFLRFCIKGQVYQFKALCFGPTVSPRVFTKVIAVIAEYLRSKAIRLAVYLDDWLFLNQKLAAILKDREFTLSLLVELGFIVNVTKSHLIPTQEITYIGAFFNLIKGMVFPTLERFQKLQLAIQTLFRGQNTARQYLVILGILASVIELVPNARLFSRPIQLHVLKHWRPVSMALDVQVPCTPQLKYHLKWWLLQKNFLMGRVLQTFKSDMELTTDSSMTGWGAHLGNQVVQGTWSKTMSLEHINFLELEAVYLALKHFLPELKSKQILIRSDNMTVIHYLNKQGGTKSEKLCNLTRKIWLLAIQSQIILRAAHLKGELNYLADSLSRRAIQSSEWSLNPLIVQKIFQVWGQPMIDLFATVQNRQCLVFCSWKNHPKAFAQDALSISWENMFVYAYPPFCMIPKVLSHMNNFQCEMILIAPMWPRQHWYPTLLSMLIACPIQLPNQVDLLCQNRVNHTNPQFLNLTAWRLSTNNSKRKVFQAALENCSRHHGGMVHEKITPVNLKNSVAGAIQNKLIPIRHL